MHPLVFGFKRGHWASVRWGLGVLRKEFKLTPARFEYLYVIGYSAFEERGGSVVATEIPPPVTQAQVRKVLDVASVTVSRMLDVLEREGLVRRWPVCTAEEHAGVSDRRTRPVQLTALGLARVLAVLAARIGPDIVDRSFCRAMVGHTFAHGDWREGWRDDFDGRAGRRLRKLTLQVKGLAHVVGDCARIWRYDKLLQDPALVARAVPEMRLAGMPIDLDDDLPIPTPPPGRTDWPPYRPRPN